MGNMYVVMSKLKDRISTDNKHMIKYIKYIMRKIKKLKVVYSREIPRKPENETGSREKKVNVGSISFVPSSAGLIIASEVVKDICNL